ncbi:hypothetical protein OWR28_22700 [Chryseobacterium sp. 1B4]
MKKILSLFWILTGFFMGLSQAPEKMSYQAVMRNGSGQLLANQAIAVKVSILQGSPPEPQFTLKDSPGTPMPTDSSVLK